MMTKFNFSLVGNNGVLYNQSIEKLSNFSKNCLGVQDCINCYNNMPISEYSENGAACDSVYDTFYCWESVPANTVASKPCPSIPFQEGFCHSGQSAFRVCNEMGHWAAEKTNFSLCLEDYKKCVGPLEGEEIPDNNYTTTSPEDIFWLISRDIYIAGSTFSLSLLLFAILIFVSFPRSLECPRISIHKNFFISLVFKYVFLILNFLPLYGILTPIYSSKGLCRTILCLYLYFEVTSVMWMLVEGLYLHRRIKVVFVHEPNFKIFYLVGWGLPAFLIAIWAGMMHLHSKEVCWNNYTSSHFVFIMHGPIYLALVTNIFVLGDIVRIILTKTVLLERHIVEQASHFRRAVKATVVLFPLFGLTYFFVFLNLTIVYGQIIFHLINSIFQSLQGSFVAVTFCFFDVGARTTVNRKFHKFSRWLFGNSKSGSSKNTSNSAFFWRGERRKQAAARSSEYDISYKSSGVELLEEKKHLNAANTDESIRIEMTHLVDYESSEMRL